VLPDVDNKEAWTLSAKHPVWRAKRRMNLPGQWLQCPRQRHVGQTSLDERPFRENWDARCGRCVSQSGSGSPPVSQRHPPTTQIHHLSSRAMISHLRRLVFDCRTTSASTAPCIYRRMCCPSHCHLKTKLGCGHQDYRIKVYGLGYRGTSPIRNSADL